MKFYNVGDDNEETTHLLSCKQGWEEKLGGKTIEKEMDLEYSLIPDGQGPGPSRWQDFISTRLRGSKK